MFRSQFRYCSQIPDPVLISLPRNRGNKIHINIGETLFPGVPAAFQKIFVSMDSSQNAQFPVAGRLKPQAEPVDPGSTVESQFFPVEGSRIRLHRNFGVRRKIKLFFHAIHDLSHPGALQKRRRSPADKHRDDLPVCQIIFPRQASDLFQKSGDIGFSCFPVRRGGQEITVRAFLHAKGNMYIQFQRKPAIILHLHPPERRSRSSRNLFPESLLRSDFQILCLFPQDNRLPW